MCGLNSRCTYNADGALCKCLNGYIGEPPNCHTECEQHSNCTDGKSCINHKCTDQCESVCGENAECKLTNHIPICQCPSTHDGDPFVKCEAKRKYLFLVKSSIHKKKLFLAIESTNTTKDHCNKPNVTVCNCLEGFVGTPPNCYRKCATNSDCSSTESCINGKCSKSLPKYVWN